MPVPLSLTPQPVSQPTCLGPSLPALTVPEGPFPGTKDNTGGIMFYTEAVSTQGVRVVRADSPPGGPAGFMEGCPQLLSHHEWLSVLLLEPHNHAHLEGGTEMTSPK